MSIHGIGPTEPNKPSHQQDLHHENYSPHDMSQYLSSTGNGTYIDFGQFFGNRIFTDPSITTWPSGNQVIFNQSALDNVLNDLFNKISQGSHTLFLSFDQMKDLKDLFSNPPQYSGDTNDTISQVFRYNAKVGNISGPDFLTYFNETAKAHGLNVVLSLGGKNASPDDWGLPTGTDPKQYAADTAKALDNFGFSGIDCDVESTGESGFTIPAMQTFLSNLHSDWANKGHTIDLTLEGDSVRSPSAGMQPFLKNFDTMFDGLNIMAYDDTKFYLSSDVLKQWVSALPKDDLSKIHIGFDDTVNYNDPSANFYGQKFNVPKGLSNGEAAACIYCQLLESSGLKPSDLGSVFMWSGKDPQNPQNSNFMKDFSKYLRKNGT